MELLFNDHPVRVFDIKGEPYFAVVDLEEAWGTKRGTVAQMIERHPEIFTGQVLLGLKLSPSQNVPDSKTANKSLTLVNERGMYMAMGRISTNQLSNPDAKKFILAFQIFVPELLQKFRKGVIVPTPAVPVFTTPVVRGQIPVLSQARNSEANGNNFPAMATQRE